ncbi:MAG: hypothetical protein H7A25_26065 [Leptospiraceae bacterium]|nr:hypothetical protein [Leptospiraceae bacterium]MCP5503392.1 hypothetical protein [Leptospiraceae bacterium]
MIKRLYITYIKNRGDGKTYSGMASGFSDANNILKRRESSHHKNKEGFGKAEIDRISYDKNAIRGREQMLIDYHGGAQSEGGTSGNIYNSISKRNKKGPKYITAAIAAFGSLIFLAVCYLIII